MHNNREINIKQIKRKEIKFKFKKEEVVIFPYIELSCR